MLRSLMWNKKSKGSPCGTPETAGNNLGWQADTSLSC